MDYILCSAVRFFLLFQLDILFILCKCGRKVDLNKISHYHSFSSSAAAN